MVNISLQYLAWHYRYGLPNLFSMMREFVRFVFNLFSINLFLRTLFKPMFSLQGSAHDQKLVADAISIIVANLIMRVLGFFVRSVFIFIGLLGITITVVWMIALIVLWTLLPLVLFISLYVLIASLIS